ncbi:hypothetical protein Q4517_13695 [Tenacibaculum sp. 1_MG-2023]|uniref:hypothetical protein n=1 Tax=Tenacibaculum sp. 1_MG-2023 TaxID=3062653 RepID=UPI0026E390DA|nr:hypothetical protein [Tenacibaculum sp. 1_MG-2023]MDO6676597.1 hypothetical protein [Tenacibaculum sp. 1_MG-2023]
MKYTKVIIILFLFFSCKTAIKRDNDIIIAVTKNEGKLDSVQSYDSEILSASAIQKTINIKGEGEE